MTKQEEQEKIKEDAIEKLAKSFTDYKKWG